MGQNDSTREWGPAKRLLFRFTFAYFALYVFPFPVNGIPLVFQGYADLWDAPVRWVGARVFGVDITVRPNGSGDTTWNYVQVFCFLVLASAATLAWTLLDRKRGSYPRLFQGLRVWVRYYLASVMFLYGVVKVIPTQFPPPTLDRLVQPFGDASPMGLLWTFMGASTGYNFFTGCGELLGGLLLTTRRTTLLGALVCVGVLSNIVALNFCYDVPVKLFSCHLLLMAFFLIAPDLRRLADLFLLGRVAGPFEFRPFLPGWKWTGRAAAVLRTLLVAGWLGVSVHESYDFWRQRTDPAARSVLYGIWEVENFKVDGRPLDRGDPGRWKRVIFDFPSMLALQHANDSRERYRLALDADARTLTLTRFDDKEWKSVLTYAGPDDSALSLKGTFGGKEVQANLRRADEKTFRLVSRGFHWVNEYPFNR